MDIKFWDVIEEEWVRTLEFPSFEEAKKVADYINEMGINIQGEEYCYAMKFDPIENAIIFYMERDE